MTNDLFNQEENRALDEIIARRRSIRAFKPEAPPEGLVEQVILAGLRGPYAGLVERRGAPYRLFRVVRQGPLMNKVQDAIKEQAKASLARLKGEMADGPRPGEGGTPFLKRLGSIAESGIPSLKDAPFFIVAAEGRGIPPVEYESLAHCLENMWLKATALGLGFQLLTVTKMLSGSREFFELVNLEYGRFLLNGCALGYPQYPPQEKQLPEMKDVVEWL